MAKQDWLKAQKHEKEYYFSGKNKQWKTPHSLEYWKNFLHLKTLDGTGVEVGCGPNGLYNFTEKVVGLDPINYKRKNFIVGVAEALPFKKVDYVICCNGIDHFKDIEKSLDEMLLITNKIIIWTNVFPYIISRLLNIFDRTHPHHLTLSDVVKLIAKYNLFVDFFTIKGIYSIHGKHASKKAKLKLYFASLLGIKGLCLHLKVKK